MISEKWQYFLKKHGDVIDRADVPNDVIDEYKGKLPDTAIAFWRECGWGSYAGGMIKICNPADFKQLLQLVFRGDAVFSSENSLIYAFTAFGKLLGLHEKFGTFEIDLLTYEMTAFEYVDQSTLPVPESDVVASLYGMDAKQADPGDESGKNLFPRAVKKHGIPATDECFGFAPALPMGGTRRLASLQKYKARAHFALLAQIQPVTLMDYRSFPKKTVRTIGA